MVRKILILVIVTSAALILVGYVSYLGNVAPAVPSVSVEEAARADKPYVVKLHAQWCPVCMVTKGVWSQIEETYAGRVHLVVLDFTSEANTEASRVEAARLGLGGLFDEYGGVTGVVVVLDGRTKQVTSEIGGSRDFAHYQRAIDAALALGRPRATALERKVS
jgi:thiol-disulfide isomerase/thioredoxin